MSSLTVARVGIFGMGLVAAVVARLSGSFQPVLVYSGFVAGSVFLGAPVLRDRDRRRR